MWTKNAVSARVHHPSRASQGVAWRHSSPHILQRASSSSSSKVCPMQLTRTRGKNKMPARSSTLHKLQDVFRNIIPHSWRKCDKCGERDCICWRTNRWREKRWEARCAGLDGAALSVGQGGRFLLLFFLCLFVVCGCFSAFVGWLDVCDYKWLLDLLYILYIFYYT